ncbi:MAG: protein kinase [Gemmataceae bacterium]
MTTPLSRSDVELLERLLLGRLTPAEADQLAARYADDERLASLAESLEVGPDALLAALKNHQPQDDPEAEPLVRGLLQRLRDTGVTQETSAQTAGDPGGASPPARPLPECFEYFRVLQLLGEGGMGQVYLAEDTRLGRPVALKTIRREAVEKPGAKDRFLREARSAARLEHDHIVPIYYVGEADGAPFLAMPYLPGEGLDRRLRRDKEAGRAMPVVEAIRIARQIASGLARAHAQGLIHRDIKPNNVWLEAVDGPAGEPRVRILDFGLARSQQDDASLTASGVVVGTPTYMAPEQARGQAVDGRADLFSLGCVLYQMLTGDRPFTGANHLAVLASLAIDTPPAPHEVRPDCPRELSDLTMRLLAKRPEDRPESAEEAVRLLTGLQDARSRPPGDPPPAAAAPARRRAPYLVAASLLALLPLAWWLAGVILRVETKDGTLVVELADEDVEARIRNGELQLVGADGKVKYALRPSEKNRAALAPGEYRIRVSGADGLKLDTEAFEMKQGGRVTVRVTVEAGTAERKQGVVADTDRKAAEYVISIGGAVQVNGLERQYRQEPDLPRGPFRLSGVFFGNNIPVNDAGLAVFRECGHLTRLNLYFNKSISDAGLANFKNCKNWRHLGLSGTKVSDAGLGHFKDCSNLRILGLGDTSVTDLGVARFKDCKKLNLLDVSNTRISDAGLAYFKGCSELTSLYLNGLQVSEEGMSAFKDCRKLKVVALYKSTVDDAGLAQLPPQLELELLNVGGTSVTDVGLAHFKNLSKVVELGLNYKMTEASLARLKECKSLPGIGLAHMQITEVGVSHLKECSHLKWLDLRNAKVPATGIEVLKKALPRCRITWDGGVIEPPREAGK